MTGTGSRALRGAMTARGARYAAHGLAAAVLLAAAFAPGTAPAQGAPSAVTLVPRLAIPITGLDRCENHYSTNTGGNKPDEFLLPGFGRCWTNKLGFVEVWVERPQAEACRRVVQTSGVRPVTTLQGAYTCQHWEVPTCPLGYLPINSNTGCLQLAGAVPDKQPPACPACGNPINFATGEKSQRESDYRGAGAAPLAFERYYSSRVTMPLAHLGPGWRHSYDLWLVVSSNGVSEAAYAQRPDGRVLGFSNASDPLVWRADPDITHRLYTVLDPDGQRVGFRLLRPDGTEEIYDADGRIRSITPRGGHTLSIDNDDLGRPVRVSDPFPQGRALEFEYGEGGRLSAVVDPAGGRIEYGYDTEARLSSVRYPDDTPEDPSDAPVRRYHYENADFPLHLTGITDENGVRFASWSYDASGRAVVSEHAGGAGRIEVLYQADGSVHTVDALGRVHRYTLGTQFGVRRVLADEDGVCNGCGGASATTYDASGFVATRTDRNGRVTAYVHDARGLEVSRTEAAGTALERTVTTQWHPVYRVPVRIEQPGKVTTYGYDADGRLLSRSESDPVSGRARTTTYTYDADGLPVGIDGPRTDVADVTSLAYDGGDLVRITNALGHSTDISSYDPHGRALEVVDPNGLVTRFAYDARGRMRTRSVDAQVTAYDRDAVGQVTRMTLPDGSFLDHVYDDARRLVATGDALGNRVEYDLDASGNRIEERVLDPGGALVRTRSRTFDALGRLVRETGGAGQVWDYGYDALGLLLTREGPGGRTTTHAYDALNRLARSVDAAGGETVFEYDARDNLTSVTDARGLTTTYAYDGLDDLLAEHSPDRGDRAYATDAAGNRVARTDARGITATHAYDALGRMTEARFPDASNDITYTYDTAANGIGRVASVADASGVTTHAYDVRGNPVRETRELAGQTYAVDYAYDAADRVARITYPSGVQVEYLRDAAGQVARVNRIDADGANVLADDIAHEPFGPVRALRLGNGLSATTGFDLDGRVVDLSTPGVLERAYAYDAADNVEAIDDPITPAASQQFDYDVLDRLIAAQGAYGVLGFEHDAIGNRTTRSGPAGVDTYAYEASSNRLLEVFGPNAQAFTYDAAGNAVVRGVHEYVYDDDGRLVQTRIAGAPQASFTYNAAGERSTRTTANGVERFVFGRSGELLARAGPDGAVAEEYVYLDGQLLARIGAGAAEPPGEARIELAYDDRRRRGRTRRAEVTVEPATGHFTLREHGQVVYQDTLGVWQLRARQRMSGRRYEVTLLARFSRGTVVIVALFKHLHTGAYTAAVHVNAKRSGGGRIRRELVPRELVSATEVAATPGSDASGVRYYHLDHLGTPQALTDEAGQVTWAADYLPFGEVVETVTDDEQAVRFPGQYADDAVGGYYNYQRWYDSSTGRYLTSDPIGLAGGINTYGYAKYNPLRYSDPRGLQAVTGALPIGGGLAAADGPFPFGDLIGLTIIAGAAIYDMCQEKECPPCKTVTGKIVPVGTIGYRPLDVIPDDVKQHGVYGSHHNIFIAKQAPRGTPQPCRCFWQKQKYVLKPEQLTPDMIPVEEFVYTGG